MLVCGWIDGERTYHFQSITMFRSLSFQLDCVSVYLARRKKNIFKVGVSRLSLRIPTLAALHFIGQMRTFLLVWGRRSRPTTEDIRQVMFLNCAKEKCLICMAF